MTERRAVQCEGHGEAWETYVCEHLVKKPKQAWFSDDAFDEENPWPDAWCAKCNIAYAREGEWNERNEGEVPIKLLCSACYIERRMLSVEGLAGKQKKRWKAYVAEACAQQDEAQREMIERFQLDRYQSFRVDMEGGALEFTGERLPPLSFEIEVIGSFSKTSDTWLWAWCNWHLPAVVRSRVRALRDVGDQEDFVHLREPKWAAEEDDGWHMAAIAARALGALGIYRLPNDPVTTFVALMALRA